MTLQHSGKGAQAELLSPRLESRQGEHEDHRVSLGTLEFAPSTLLGPGFA